MNEDEVAAFVAGAESGYIDQRIASGENPDEARRIAGLQTKESFPDGRPAPGQLLFRVLDDEAAAVGSLWIGPRTPQNPAAYWVWDVEIEEAERGKGFGRAAMVLAEEAARARGATELGLNVFGHNTAARSLYESMGYQTAAINMRKPLVP
jgi:ribosomal protein S18 acetylase RimI-like enzyme